MATIISELLCYMLNKVDSVPQDTLVRLIAENFSEDEVENAKGLICSHVPDSVKAGNRRGPSKKTTEYSGYLQDGTRMQQRRPAKICRTELG